MVRKSCLIFLSKLIKILTYTIKNKPMHEKQLHTCAACSFCKFRFSASNLSCACSKSLRFLSNSSCSFSSVSFSLTKFSLCVSISDRSSSWNLIRHQPTIKTYLFRKVKQHLRLQILH